MGNCQAAEAAAVVIQHPWGRRTELLYWPTVAGDVMRANPGHHVALITTALCVDPHRHEPAKSAAAAVRFTRVRILKPHDTLLLGHVYRLVSNQDVSKALRERKYQKMKKNQHEADSVKQQENGGGGRRRSRAASRGQRQWQPSLQSISEAAGS